MALKIEFLDGQRTGDILEFGDDIESIQNGRDPQRCKVVIPPDVTTVGREHCTLSRVRGRYYMEMAAEKKVTLEGNLMDTVQAIPEDCVVQIGPGGPKLRIMTSASTTWRRRCSRESTPKNSIVEPPPPRPCPTSMR